MKETIKKVWNTVTTVLVALVAALAMMIWGVQLFGLDVLVVQSGSMEPEYPTGSLVYILDVDAAELEVGDVVTFRMSSDIRGTHRIIELVPDENDPAKIWFRTKGDANDHADSGLLQEEDILGKAVFCIPWLGYLISYIQNPPGMYVAIAVGCTILLLTFLPDILFEEEKKEADEAEKEEDGSLEGGSANA